MRLCRVEAPFAGMTRKHTRHSLARCLPASTREAQEDMITFETQLANQRRARGFFRELPDPQAAEAIMAGRYWDNDDQAREPVLRNLLARTNVAAIAYPTLGHRDVIQLFLRDSDGDDLVFACVLVSGARLQAMLAQSSPIVEGFALQVLPGEHLSVESIRAALQSWVERCFPDLVLPDLTVQTHTVPCSRALSARP